VIPRPKALLLDADGTLWRGGEVLPHAVRLIETATAAGIRCLLISNNAGPDRAAYLAKCRKLGLPLEAQDIYSVNYLSGIYLARHHPGKHVLVLGSEMLAASVSKYADATHAASWLDSQGLGGRLEAAEQLSALRGAAFDVVLCGIDLNVSYAKLALACVALEQGAALVAANIDPTFPFEAGMTLPGNGSLVRLLSSVSGKEAEVLGKPGLALLELIEQETGLPRADMLVVGDRFETDIEMAQRAGIASVLVLTGVTGDAARAREQASRLQRVTVLPELGELAGELGLKL